MTRPNTFIISQVDTVDTVYCESQATTDAIALPTVTDACGVALTAEGPTISTNIENCTGTKTFTYTYQNCAGVDTTWNYTFHISLPETIANVPANGSASVPCLVDVFRPAADTITDVCGNNVIPVFTDSTATVNADGSGTVVFSYTYTDCAGHDSLWTYTYTLNPASFSPVQNDTVTVHRSARPDAACHH